MIRQTGINGLLIIQPKSFGDERGYFMETYNDRWEAEIGTEYRWVQDNEAFSSYGVLRGLHYQTGEHSQAKLVRVIQGKVLDMVVDLRQDSPSYGKVFGEVLSGDNKLQMLIPRGFAHGYVVLSDTALFAYKCDNFYSPSAEGGIHPLDPRLDIDWMVDKEKIVLSQKDNQLPTFGNHIAAL